jgi:hypothetical protein
MSFWANSLKLIAAHVSRRPAIPVAIVLMLGIFTHAIVPEYPIVSIILLGISVLGAAYFYRGMSCAMLLLIATFISGILLTQIEENYYPRDHISAFATDQPRLARMELRIDYPPRVLSSEFGEYRALPPKQVATATVLKIKTWTGWADCNGQVLVQISQPNPRLKQGDIIRIFGLLERPGPSMNPGQFDWANYYREQRVLASVQINRGENITILKSTGIGPLSWLREKSRRLLAMGFEPNRALDHALLRALVLGDNDPELRDVQEQFRKTGTSHQLAVSGMHVAVLGFFLFGICRLLRVRPRIACWTALLFVILYGLIAMPSAPIVRSVLLCMFCRRRFVAAKNRHAAIARDYDNRNARLSSDRSIQRRFSIELRRHPRIGAFHAAAEKYFISRR